MKKAVLFDLDGTLTDPYEGITKSVCHALAYYGIEEHDATVLRSFIGPPLARRFCEVYGFTEEESKTVVAKFRERFRSSGIFENVLYDGIPTMLSALRKRGYTLAVATSKPQEFAEQVLAMFHIADYFTVVSGSSLDGSHIEKKDVIQRAMSQLNVSAEQTVMIGDTRFDIEGAQLCSLASIGVTWGYAAQGDFAAADAVANAPADIVPLVERLFQTGKGTFADIWTILYHEACRVRQKRTLSPFIEAGSVGAAILTETGNIYVGVCIDTASTLGMCAERNAIANMITNGEHQIDKVVAVTEDGKVGSPCGACREYMMQLDRNSGDIEILLDMDTRKTVRLGELIPDWWGKSRFES